MMGTMAQEEDILIWKLVIRQQGGQKPFIIFAKSVENHGQDRDMKVRYNKHYLKIALKTPISRLEVNKHHIIPLQFIDNSMTIDLPYNLHNSLHKNFSNYQLLTDPIGCLIKCIEQRKPKIKESLTLGHLLNKQGIKLMDKPRLISDKVLLGLIKNGFAYNIKEG
jgi:hypothetical protein